MGKNGRRKKGQKAVGVQTNQDTKSDGFSKGMLEEVYGGSAKARIIIQLLKQKAKE